MLGAIIGDIVGSVYEFNNYRAKDFTPFFHRRAFYTDDTVCTIAVADALINERHPGVALKDWGQRYWENGGWGGRFAVWLASASLEPYGSYGNGAAMRVAPAGLLAGSIEEAVELSDRVTGATHNHPEGLKGGAATACAIVLARQRQSPMVIREFIAREFGYDMDRTVDGIRPAYVFNETCQRTVPEALICALEASDFEDAIRNAISIGGDSDTVGAIAGGVAEALFGIPEDVAGDAWRRLPDDMRTMLTDLYARAGSVPMPWTESGD